MATYSNATVNAGADMEEVVEEVEVNAALSNDSLASQYATNANGVGAKKSITVDGDISDWNSSMLIAQGAANDDPRVYKNASMHELPVDLYALYGAYDDNNLYLMWEMTNVQDVVAPAEDYPLSQGILFQTQEFPFHILIDTGKSDTAIGNSGKTQTGGTIWNTGLTTTNSFNKWICFNTKGGNGPWVYGGDSTGVNEVELLGPKTTESNISVKFGKGILSEKIVGINDAYGTSEFGSHNRVVGDVCDNSAAWADFNTLGHSSSTMDFHYEVSIPLSELGISASDVENTGVGVLLLSTFGLSAMDCLPYDVAMNDNADQDDTQSQPGNSFEKSDADNVTCTFARIGNGDVPTQRPTAVPTTEPTTAPTDAPILTQVPGGDMAVNFGADRSAPQYNSTALEIKAIVSGGTAPYNYEFFVDDTSVKNGTEDTYTWQNGSAGAHTIKVVVTDGTGKTVTSTKAYDLEQDGDTPINTPVPTQEPTPVPTGVVTVTAAPTPTTGAPVSSKLRLTKFLVSCLTEDGSYKIGDTYILRAGSENAKGTAQYMFTYILNGEEVIVKNYGPETEARFVATEAGTYTFKVYAVDESNDANPKFETGEIIILDVPNLTITPVPTTPADVTVAPTVTPKVTETPVVTEKPSVTETPVATGKPATPTQKPSEPAKGSKVTVGKATYKVTQTGSSKAVEYTGYTGTSTTVNIPSTVKIDGVSYKVTSVAAKAFKGNTSLKVVKIPANVTKIGKEAFSGCTNLGKVKQGVNVTSIGDKAFYNCKNLSSITMSKKLTTIGKSAFYKCVKLKKITLNSKVKKIGAKAFYGCKNLKTITIKTTKLTSKNVGSSAFKGINSKATVKVPKSKLKAYKKLIKSKGAGSKVSYKKA